VDGASGQLEKRVTSGTDNSARNAGTSFGVAARKLSRVVDNTGNLRLAVGGMVSSAVDFASQTFRTIGINCRFEAADLNQAFRAVFIFC